MANFFIVWCSVSVAFAAVFSLLRNRIVTQDDIEELYEGKRLFIDQDGKIKELDLHEVKLSQ